MGSISGHNDTITLAALNQLDQAIFIQDKNGKIRYLNRMAEEMSGWSGKEALERPLSEVVRLTACYPEAHRPKIVTDLLNQFLTEKEGVTCVVTSKQGCSRIVKAHAGLIDNSNGQSGEMLVTFQDVTDHVKTTALLKEHLRKQHTIIENTGTAILIVEKDGSISFVNEGFERFSGYAKDEIVGLKKWKEFIATEDEHKFTGYGHLIFREELFDSKNDEFGFIDRWGNRKSVHMIITLIREKSCSLVSLIDISRRKRMEKELTRSREHIRKLSKQTELFSLAAASILSMKNEKEIFSSISQAIIEHSDFNRVVIAYLKETPPFRDIIGHGGMDDETVRKMAAAEVPESWYRDLFENGVKVGPFSCYLPHSRIDSVGLENGSQEVVDSRESSEVPWHPEEALYVRMNDQKGKLICVISVDGSKTGKKPTAKTVRPLEIFSCLISQIIINRKAQEETKKLERQLIHANKMESIGTLASGIAHDFNNLLTGILGNISLMDLTTDEADVNQVFIQRITGLVESGADLTRQILGFARDGKYEVRPTNLNQVLQKSADMFVRTKREIQIIEEYQEDLWTIEVDRGQMEQMLLNLFVNSAHAMPDGGKIYLKTENVVIDEFFMKPYQIKPGKYVKCTVTDTGTGMDKATMQRIFDPFFTTKEMGRGTGLGLASVYGIVKNHDGFINVYSELNQGAAFTVYLPFSGKELESTLNTDMGLLNGNETILLIDDEESIRIISKEMLEELGYHVLLAASGQEGVSLYETSHNTIDLVVLDMIMPEMGGGETFDRLRAIHESVKVLLSSGYSMKAQAKNIKGRGFMGFIQKPFGLKELALAVRKILDQTPPA